MAELENVSSNRYYETAKVIYDLAEKMNENGEDSFPIHGTCLDFSLFLFWEVEDERMCFVMDAMKVLRVFRWR